MNDALHRHIAQSVRSDAWIDFALAAGALLGGLAVLTVSYFAAFVLAKVLFFVVPLGHLDSSFPPHLFSALVVGLAFFESWRTQRRLFEGYSNEHSAGGAAMSAGLYMLGVGWGPRGVLPLSPGTSRNLIKVLADILYSGPRLLRNSARLVRRGRAKSSADLHACADVLDTALETGGRLSFRTIRDLHPGIDLDAVLEQMSWLTGIVYLKSDPPGITLTDTLRARLEAVVEAEG